MTTVPARRLPSRDERARSRLREVAGLVRPPVGAGERRLEVPGPLGALLPGGGVRRGATVRVDGITGAGGTSLALALAAAATGTGEWAAIVDPSGTLGARAAEAAGVALERCAVVRRCPADRWSTVVAALLDGVALVVATVPSRVRPGDARRLVARARERASVLVAVGPWPVEAAVRIAAEGSTWSGLGSGCGRLDTQELHVRVETNGVPARAPVRALAG
jgi:hypothetical protein